MRRALIVEDDRSSSEPLAQLLGARGYDAAIVDTISGARTWLDTSDDPELVVLDMGLPDGDGMILLHDLAQRPGHRAVVVLTGQRELERAVAAMRLGALDYLIKPLRPAVFEATLSRVDRALADDAQKRELRRQLAELGSFEGLVGSSRVMQRVYELVERGAPSRVPIFIEGESGTGKEMLARAVHRVSPRRDRRFVALNCGAIPANLVESELFGHERGAFTGANARRDGVFQQAHGGTLFLDELGEMPMDLQVRLLRVLETGRVRRVGGTSEQSVDVRIISATNRDPAEAVANGRLREDLYYRLYVFPIRLPPLRERTDDIDALARHFLREGTEPMELSAEAVEALKAHRWPGNVRELRNALSRASLLAIDGVIRVDHLPASLSGGRREVSSPADALVLSAGVTLDEAQRRLVQWYLERFDGHRGKTSAALGVTPKTLYNKCKAWGLSPGG